ncbi:hypothetical protein H5410_056199 [Solanum commersonii]|uniref:Uncharacterized protein n=1 Tax=Solanum commersonii TaxID=4109 RepID=A0A9J5WJL7_SOLCO|nr:hypothetical protein H5410_056199 [Solanum commersonii]
MSKKDLMGRKNKKGNPWIENEHKPFFKRFNFHGKGHWAKITKNFLPSRTSIQVASHAQKYFVRLLNSNSNSNERKRGEKSR